MTAGLPGEYQGWEVQREQPGHRRRPGPHRGPEEHVEHPRQGDQQGAVHFRFDDRPDEHAECEVDDRDQYRRCDSAGRVGDPRSRRQSHKAPGRRHHRQAQRRTEAPGNDGGVSPAGGREAPISGAGPGDLEEPCQPSECCGCPTGGGGLDLGAIAGSTEEFGEVGQGPAPDEDEHDRNDDQ